MGRTYKGTESPTESVKWNQPIGTKNNSFFQHVLLTVTHLVNKLLLFQIMDIISKYAKNITKSFIKINHFK